MHFSRRDLFTGRLFRREPPPPAPPPRLPPLMRPPGAVPEPEFLRMCNQCGDCLVACPREALYLAHAGYGEAAGTPMFDPVRQPCWMCPDTPCIDACKPLALRGASGAFPRIGLATIRTADCIAFQGGTCTSCFERCPSSGALVIESGLPRIDPALCTGCGVCQYACPVAGKAIDLQPSDRTEPPVPIRL